MCAAELCQAPLTYCSSTGGRLSACCESVSWRQRQETPSLMAGNSSLRSRRGDDISFRISSPACAQGNYCSWRLRELKFNLDDLRSPSSFLRKNHHLSKWVEDEDGEIKMNPVWVWKKKITIAKVKQKMWHMIKLKIPKSLFCLNNGREQVKIKIKREQSGEERPEVPVSMMEMVNNIFFKKRHHWTFSTPGTIQACVEYKSKKFILHAWRNCKPG